MKCKTFKIHLQDEARDFEEVKLNKFLENATVHNVFASVVNNEFWTVLAFYDDGATASVKSRFVRTVDEEIPTKTFTEKPVVKAEAAPPEPIILTDEEENIYAALREWRNMRASQDGLSPYMIAHNDSLMQMAKQHVKTLEELPNIKGFGEKRTQKYGEEILQIITTAEGNPA
jgi:superfamily II DNA helicase RecQ